MTPCITDPPMIYRDDFVERFNVGWRIEPGEQDPNNPLIEPQYPWDGASPCVGHGTVIKDPIDGRFKAWVVVIADEPPQPWVVGDIDSLDTKYTQHKYDMRLAHYVSEDGVHWERPMSPVGAVPGHDRTNLVFPEACGETTYASVFIDPEENGDEPYEMFVFHNPIRRFSRQHVVPGFTQPGRGLFRYRSRDGVSWRPIEGPRRFYEDGDGLYVFRTPGNTYEIHQKIGVEAFPGGILPYDCYPGGSRTMWRRTSDDGSTWSERYPIQLPEWHDHHADQFMDLGYHPYGEGIIAINTIYHAAEQTLDPVFAASVEGKKWWRPSRRPCLPLAPLGDVGSGMIWMTRDLVRDGDRMVLYYGATNGIHGDIHAKVDNQFMFYGVMCRASWRVGRMWAAVPACGGPIPARLTTALLPTAGKTLYVNAATLRDGEITAELLGEDLEPLPGYTRDDAVPLRGDELRTALRWKQHATISAAAAHVRFQIKCGRLYGYQVA